MHFMLALLHEDVSLIPFKWLSACITLMLVSETHEFELLFRAGLIRLF